MKISALTPLKRATARLLLVALVPVTFGGCVSTDVERTAPPTDLSKAPRTGAFEGRLYETGALAKKGQKSPRAVNWKLFLVSNPDDPPVREGTGSVWNAVDLEPGKYRIVASWEPAPGVAGDTSAGSTNDSFKLAAGETAVARVIVKKVPTGLVVGVGVAVAVGIAVAIAANQTIHVGEINLGRSLAPTAIEPYR
jgi:hypothetical protein